MISGWKTITGAIFGAAAITLPQLKDLIDPQAYQWLMVIFSFIGTALTAVGIGHKIDKIKK